MNCHLPALSRPGSAVPALPRMRGVGLLEVLVALIILSLGALGIAGLQATAHQSGHESQQRLLATFLANDIVERMRLNPTALDVYAATDISGTTFASEPVPDCSTSSPCTPSQLATHDLWEWEQALIGTAIQNNGNNVRGLIQPTGCISNNGGQISVVIAWRSLDEVADAGAAAGNDPGCGTASAFRRQLVINTFIN